MLNASLRGRGSGTSQVKDQLKNGHTYGNGDSELVLAEVPDCPDPVAARVLRMHGQESADVAWFDEAGYFVMAAGVPCSSFRHYDLNTSTNSCCPEALAFRRAEEALRQTNEPNADSDRTVALTPASSKISCSRGHALTATQPGCLIGCSRVAGICQACGCKIPRQKVRMRCRHCNFDLCEPCWVQRHLCMTDARKSSLTGLQLRCLKGHHLEQLAGQAACAERPCSLCGQEALGATAPFFLACQPCRYNLCDRCARTMHQQEVSSNMPSGKAQKANGVVTHGLLKHGPCVRFAWI